MENKSLGMRYATAVKKLKKKNLPLIQVTDRDKSPPAAQNNPGKGSPARLLRPGPGERQTPFPASVLAACERHPRGALRDPANRRPRFKERRGRDGETPLGIIIVTRVGLDLSSSFPPPKNKKLQDPHSTPPSRSVLGRERGRLRSRETMPGGEKNPTRASRGRGRMRDRGAAPQHRQPG